MDKDKHMTVTLMFEEYGGRGRVVFLPEEVFDRQRQMDLWKRINTLLEGEKENEESRRA